MHLTGDAVLREVAKRVTESVRSYDTVGRYGGEEFVVVLPNCGTAEIEQNAERIRLAISSVPILTDPAKITITVSVWCDPGHRWNWIEQRRSHGCG